MTFILHNHKEAQVGDCIRLSKNISTIAGTFTKGHELKCISRGDRGLDFEDNMGNKLLETGFLIDFYIIIPCKK